MIEYTIGSITIPSLDFIGYFTSIVNFFITHESQIVQGLNSAAGWLMGLSIPLSLALFIGILYCTERIRSLRKIEESIYNKPIEMGYDQVSKADKKAKNKWTTVLKHIESDKENDWRQAILEADIILADLLTVMGYKGDGIGEQLQRVSKGDFKTLNEAWEAHKVRNNIAHEGSELELTHHEARRVINLFKKVFEEFNYI